MPKILIVDDDERVLRAMNRALNDRFEIKTALGTETVREILENEGPFDAVISDFLMPGGLTGADVLYTARRRYPAIGCILHSGGTGSDVKLEDVVREHCPVDTVLLKKPSSRDDMVAALSKVMPQW